MRIELYICDNCKKQLSKGGSGKQHLSINFGQQSGWVNINVKMFGKYWVHFSKINGIKQFCNGKCLGEYFDKLIKKPVAKTVKTKQ